MSSKRPSAASEQSSPTGDEPFSSASASAPTEMQQILQALNELNIKYDTLSTNYETVTTRLSALKSVFGPIIPSIERPSIETSSDSGNADKQSMRQQPLTAVQQKRYRVADISYFDPDATEEKESTTSDVFVFTDRVKEVATLKPTRLVQLNLRQNLLTSAARWHDYEIDDFQKQELRHPAVGVSAWIEALMQRFRPEQADTLHELNEARYTRHDAANKNDSVAFLHTILRLIRPVGNGGLTMFDRLAMTYERFEAPLRLTLLPSEPYTTVEAFVRQLNSKRGAWFEQYKNFGKQPYASASGNRERNDSNYAPNRYPRQQSSQRYPRALPPTQQQGSQQHPPQQPRAHFAEHEDDNDTGDPYSYWGTAGPPSALKGPPPPTHTPRRFGNAHDDSDNQGEAYWGDYEYNCSHPECSHRHNG